MTFQQHFASMWWAYVVIVVMICLSAYFSASEIAFNPSNKMRLRRAAEGGEKGAVDVDTAVLGVVQHRLGQDLTVGHNGDTIGLKSLQLLINFLITEACRLVHRQVMGKSQLLHIGHFQLHATVFGHIRLGVYPNDLMATTQKTAQTGGRNIRGSHENDSHSSSSVP